MPSRMSQVLPMMMVIAVLLSVVVGVPASAQSDADATEADVLSAIGSLEVPADVKSDLTETFLEAINAGRMSPSEALSAVQSIDEGLQQETFAPEDSGDVAEAIDALVRSGMSVEAATQEVQSRLQQGESPKSIKDSAEQQAGDQDSDNDGSDDSPGDNDGSDDSPGDDDGSDDDSADDSSDNDDSDNTDDDNSNDDDDDSSDDDESSDDEEDDDNEDD